MIQHVCSHADQVCGVHNQCLYCDANIDYAEP